MGQESRPPAGTRRFAVCLLGLQGRSVHGGCGGPVLDVGVAHLGQVVKVVVRHLLVVGRRCDHHEPERGAGRRRGRPAIDVIGHGESGRDIAVRRVDLDGGQVVEGDAASRRRVSGSTAAR